MLKSTMDFDDPPEVAGQFAGAAMAAMARLGVAPVPANFLIWYSHCSSRHPELSEALHSLESGGARLTASLCAELYERFFGPTPQTLLINGACARIEAAMARLLEEVDAMSADAGAYGGKLQDFGHGLQAGDGAPPLRGLVAQILGETRKMLARTQHLEGELDRCSKQVKAMRDDVANARREANTDSLTGIANRRRFEDELRRAAEQAEVRREPMSLLIADIDHFKAFNDAHGHQLGDQVLKEVAHVLTRSIKGRDLAARYGGEEFAVILPQTGLEGTRALAEQIRRTVAGRRVRIKATGRDLGGITLSIGCAQLQWGVPPAELLRRADAALYRAKRRGRNRVAVATRLLEALTREFSPG
jgi:diguanylate cyclase